MGRINANKHLRLHVLIYYLYIYPSFHSWPTYCTYATKLSLACLHIFGILWAVPELVPELVQYHFSSTKCVQVLPNSRQPPQVPRVPPRRLSSWPQILAPSWVGLG